MGRKPTRWPNLPKGMRARPRGQKVFFYLDTGAKPRKEIPLGADYVVAVRKWAELAEQKMPEADPSTFPYCAQEYFKQVLPTKAPETQKGNHKELEWLLKFFGDPPAPMAQIKPSHIKAYLRWRIQETIKIEKAKNEERAAAGRELVKIEPNRGHVRANREKALFSHIWNFAREEGLTDLPNPCLGVKSHKETGRGVFIDDPLLARVMEHAVKPLEFALRLYHLTGQRPADGLRLSETNISKGLLHVKQGKTQAKLRIIIDSGELGLDGKPEISELRRLIDEMAAYKAKVTPSRKVRTLALLVNEKGQKLTADMLRNDFDNAREAAGIDKAIFQIRDLRAKAATEVDDTDGTGAAQSLLGHTTQTMTADYIRHIVGKKVKPSK